MQHGNIRKTMAAAALVASAAGALLVGCTPAGEGSDTTPSGSGGPSATGPARPCAAADVEVSPGHQAADRPEGTGTGAAVFGVTNTGATPCTLRGFPTVAGAGNGSPDRNVPLTVRHTGNSTPVRLTPGGRAWVKLTFAQVQGEGDGYCASGSAPITFPTLVLGLPGAGGHQTAMDDGVVAECDNTVTVTALSAAELS